MSDWNSSQYLRFEQQRTQPAIDLAKKIRVKNPREILDVGCGPGNSSHVLKTIFPHANITGLDSSKDMIKKAESAYPDIMFRQCDAVRELSESKEKYDVIFSNACLQWLPNHEKLIGNMLNALHENGELAVQMPMNQNEKAYQIMEEIICDPKWNIAGDPPERITSLSPEAYFDLLSRHATDFEIWETTYYHRMATCRSIVEWVKGARLRPYLDALDAKSGARLEQELFERISKAYAVRANEEIIFKFKRLFFIAAK